MLLSPADFRKHHATELPDPALQMLLDAAEGWITHLLGATDAVVERHETLGSGIYPTRRIATVTSVKETVGTVVTTLATNDYRVWPGGWQIERLNTGTNPRTVWTGIVELTYPRPELEIADRKRVQRELVQLDLNHNPGLNSEQIGAWEETYVNNSAMNYGLEREAILRTALGGGLVIA
jgi:hypothetical protein